MAKRAAAKDILQHSWMKENGTASDKPLDNAILTRMRGFAGMNKFKKEALKVVATTLSPEEIAGLRSLFQVRSPGDPFRRYFDRFPCSFLSLERRGGTWLMRGSRGLLGGGSQRKEHMWLLEGAHVAIGRGARGPCGGRA